MSSGQFKKGNKASKGRPKNAVNKSTKELRAAFKILLDNNLDELQETLDIIRTKNPAKYIELILKLTEYSLPKLNSVQEVVQLDAQTYKVDFQY
jgi:hypothetical protein